MGRQWDKGRQVEGGRGRQGGKFISRLAGRREKAILLSQLGGRAGMLGLAGRQWQVE